MNTSWQGEVQFAGYSDSSRSGPRVTFRLPAREDLESFVGKEGKRYMIALVEIADDETPAVPQDEPAPEPEPVAAKVVGPLCKWVAIRCGEESFQRWIRPVYDRVMGGNGTGYGDVSPADVGGWVEYARHAVLVICCVRSRKELDTNPAAAVIFHKQIRQPYSEWLQEQAVVA